MNILFYVDHSVASGFGGQERATGNVASALKDQGHICYYIYILIGIFISIYDIIKNFVRSARNSRKAKKESVDE